MTAQRIVSTAITVGALLAVARPTLAQTRDVDPDTEVARRRFDAGIALYDRGNYEQAISASKEARVAKPLPAFDYNIARCYDRLGRWPEALAAYERYLAEDPAAPDAPAVRTRVDELHKRAPKPPTTVSPPPTAAVSAPAPAPTAKPRRKLGWVWGVVGGVLGVGVGVGLGVGLGTRPRPPQATDGAVHF